jgi:hypothetical protein
MIGKTMTAPRRQRKFLERIPIGLNRAALCFCHFAHVLFGKPVPTFPGHALGLAAAVIAAVGLAAPAAIRAATTERVVVDRNSGLAISGFDPVAYFVDGVASLGKGEFEASFAGVVWRFRNEGNRGAFLHAPGSYLPQFGGYDPMGVVRGVAVSGDPRLWVVSGERLYLFATPEGRQQFVAHAERLIAAADRHWPAVERTLSP